jgi:iron(III) transport system substrate-binding protein
MDPLLPLLVGPEARDLSKWTGGKLDFADRAEQYNLVIANIVKAPLAYNPRLVSPGEIKSYKDLLDPKWKGKIVMYDPRSAGVGLAGIQFFYTKEGLGKPFIQQLLSQNLTFSREDRQILDWVVHGQYPIALGPPDKTMAEMKSKGITIELLGTEDIAEGSYLTAGVASVGVVNRAPHPNAVKVYLDYLLSAEAQLAFSKAIGYPSRRLDVPTDHLPDFVVPKPGVVYDQNYKEEALDLKDEVAQFLRTILGS